MSDLGLYLCKHTDFCAETRNLIEDVIVSIAQQNDFLSTDAKKAILRDALQGMGFSDEQLTAFAKCEIPTEYKIVPVDVSVVRGYRIYVKVPRGSDSNIIKEAAKKKIINEGLEERELDPMIDVELGDIGVMDIDWEGIQEDDE